MDTPRSDCSVCARAFEVRFRYQTREEDGAFRYYCSQQCLQVELSRPSCSVCKRSFTLEFPFQMEVSDGAARAYCSLACKDAAIASPTPRDYAGPRRIAVTGKKRAASIAGSCRCCISTPTTTSSSPSSWRSR